MHNRRQQTWQYLIERYFDNTISKEELEQLLNMAKDGQVPDELTEALKQQWEKAKEVPENTGIDWDTKFEALMSQSRPPAPVVPLRSVKSSGWWYRVSAAVILLLMIGAGVYYFSNPRQVPTRDAALASNSQHPVNNLKPGTNGAILTLSDGSKVLLDSAGNGLLAVQGKTRVINSGGKVSYAETGKTSGEVLYNTLTTPRGKQYQLDLSDGTKVWLNAGSSIRYPAVFTGTQRTVEVTGEVYFEVSSLLSDNHRNPGEEEKIPFIVKIVTPSGNGGEVQVLGTHFNINAYADEAAVKTTLLEGKVKVSVNGRSAMLAPGQQAAVNNTGTIKTSTDVDTDAVIAWKNGYFSFNETDMATLMRQIARWYDVEVVYAGAVPHRRFGGEISRNSNALEVLKIMEESEVHFRIEGKKIIVLP
jgi:ferric-dicitrate binding protein FerR (iron transport regulator)